MRGLLGEPVIGLGTSTLNLLTKLLLSMLTLGSSISFCEKLIYAQSIINAKTNSTLDILKLTVFLRNRLVTRNSGYEGTMVSQVAVSSTLTKSRDIVATDEIVT